MIQMWAAVSFKQRNVIQMLMTSFRPLINGKLAIGEVICFGIAFDFWTVFSQNYSWVTPGEKQKQLKKVYQPITQTQKPVRDPTQPVVAREKICILQLTGKCLLQVPAPMKAAFQLIPTVSYSLKGGHRPAQKHLPFKYSDSYYKPHSHTYLYSFPI